MDFGRMWIEGMQGIFDEFVGYVEKYLPKSPLATINLETSIPAQYIIYLNWFFPVNLVINTVTLILAALVSYYFISTLLRWIKIIA